MLKNKLILAVVGGFFIQFCTTIVSYCFTFAIQSLGSIDFGSGGIAILALLSPLSFVVAIAIYLLIMRAIYKRHSLVFNASVALELGTGAVLVNIVLAIVGFAFALGVSG